MFLFIYLYDCLDEKRQQGRFAGFSLYISTTGDIPGSMLCYKDGPQLPPLNFTTNCTTYGSYIIFFNERLNKTNFPSGYELDNVFTELCEVIVQGNKHYTKIPSNGSLGVMDFYNLKMAKICVANLNTNQILRIVFLLLKNILFAKKTYSVCTYFF